MIGSGSQVVTPGVDDAREVATSRQDRKAAAILSAARRHFYQDGYGATSVEAIGQVAGIGKATIYKYFGSKEKLFAAVVARENQHGLDEIRLILVSHKRCVRV